MPMLNMIQAHLHKLSERIGARPTGSPANLRAAAYIRQAMLDTGLGIEEQPFACLAWNDQGSHLESAGCCLPAMTNPFSPACDLTAERVTASTLAELDALELRGQIVILHGELSAEPYFPKHFPFLTLQGQQQIIRRLEERQCGAIIAVSPKLADLDPIFEDGDFHIPSVTVAAEVGKQLIQQPDRSLHLRIDSIVRPAQGANIIGRLGKSKQRILVCAHFDTKPNTPGACDNAAGVAALLALAQQLKAQPIASAVEFVAFNGEDYYAASGEVAYLEKYRNTFADIALVINIDGVGVRGTNNSIAFFACSEPLVALARRSLTKQPTFVEVEPWPQGDQTLFWPQGVPTLALSSQEINGLIGSVIHTPHDTLSFVSAEQIMAVVDFVYELVSSLANK
jgi:aminopeptidase YwaD